LRTPDEVAEIRGLSVNQVLGLTSQEAEPVAAETLSSANGSGASEAAEPVAEELPAETAEEPEA
jgi:hypothetical protein